MYINHIYLSNNLTNNTSCPVANTNYQREGKFT